MYKIVHSENRTFTLSFLANWKLYIPWLNLLKGPSPPPLQHTHKWRKYILREEGDDFTCNTAEMFSFGPNPTIAKKAWSSSTCLLYVESVEESEGKWWGGRGGGGQGEADSWERFWEGNLKARWGPFYLVATFGPITSTSPHLYKWHTVAQRGQCILFSVVFTPSPSISVWVLPRESQCDVVYLGWPIAPPNMSPNAGGGAHYTKKEDDRGPLSQYSILSAVTHN
jgi:hypothetical protein